MQRQQTKIVNELKAAFSDATAEVSHVAEFAFVTLTLVSSDCKSRKVNCFKVGPRGGLKIIKKEF